MKKKLGYVLLGIEALLCILLPFVRQALPGIFTAVLAFPLEQIAYALRRLSLSGAWGNALAWALYGAFCLIPLAALATAYRKHAVQKEDYLLIVISAALFAAVYLMINPGWMGRFLGQEAAKAFGSALLGGTVYALLIAYAVMKLLRFAFHADPAGLRKCLSALLWALGAAFVYLVFGAPLGALWTQIDQVRQANTAVSSGLGLTYAFLALQAMVDALPYALDLVILFAAQRLLLALDAGQEDAPDQAASLARLCARALAVTMLSSAGFNLLQIVCIRNLHVVHASVHLPVFAAAFVLAALLLAQYICENKRLRDDNDLFI